MKISEALARRIVHLRKHLWRNVDPVLDGAAVDSATKSIGCDIPDDVLAYLAGVGTTEVGGALAVVGGGEDEIDTFYRAADPPQKKWRTDCEFDHVPFDAWGDWPRFYALFARSEDSYAILDLKQLALTRYGSLVDLIDARWGDTLDFSAPVDIATFAPRVARAAATVRRVTHVKFGNGVVLGAAEGKLQIDFGEHGVKVIAEKFVKDA